MPAPRDIAYRALALGHLPLARHLPDGRYAVREGVPLVSYGLPGPGFRTAAALGSTPPPDRVLELAADFFGDAPGGWGITVDANAGHPVETEVRARGWVVAVEHPALVLSAIPEPPPPPAGLVIRRVADDHGLEEWFRAANPGARAPDDPENVDYNRLLIRSLAAALDPDIALFTGYVAGLPVASSALYRIDGVAEIGAVTTWPGFRRRGYGAALTWAAIAAGAAIGCASAGLRSTEMGFSVYVGMGFVPACTFRTYAAPAGERHR